MDELQKSEDTAGTAGAGYPVRTCKLSADERAALTARLAVLDARKRELVQEAFEIEKTLRTDACPFKIGMLVQWPLGLHRLGRTQRGVILDVVPWVCDSPQLKIQRITKSGDAGATIYVYDLDHVEII